MEDSEICSLFRRFPYLNTNEWNSLFVVMRKKPIQCPPRVRDDLVRMAFRTRPPFASMNDTLFYGTWIIFVLRTLWPHTAGLRKTPTAKELAEWLSHTNAIGVLLYGSEADYNQLLKNPNLRPQNTHSRWEKPQQDLLKSLAYHGTDSKDSERTFVYDWSDEGQERFIDQVMQRLRTSREPYPASDLKQGERRLTRHHTLQAMAYIAWVVSGIILVQSVIPLSGEVVQLLIAFPVVVFVFCAFIWGFPALLPHLVDFIRSCRQAASRFWNRYQYKSDDSR